MYISYDERYSVVKIPVKFINFENDDKDHLELNYKAAQFISRPGTKEECQNLILSFERELSFALK